MSQNTALAVSVAVLLGVFAGCTPDELTQVLVRVDAQPGLRAGAATLEVRVFDHERNVVLDASRILIGDASDSVELPAVLPLVPLEGDTTRSFVVEATLLDDVGGILARGRGVGRYVAGEVREALLCLEDVCRGELCGDTATDCEPGATTCRTCVGPDQSCEDPTVETFAVGAGPAMCPAPSCEPAGALGDPETECGDGADDDCDGAVDCEDVDCDGNGCGDRGLVCADGACTCPTEENTPEACRDGISNDCDEAVDCADVDCAGQACDMLLPLVCNFVTGICGECPGMQTTETSCADSVDNDCDGFADCADPDCCGEVACEGQMCAGDEALRCCGGSCVSVHTRERCGGCAFRCGVRAGDRPFECVRIGGQPPAGEPGRFACRCNLGVDENCPGDTSCQRREERTVCQCNSDDDCATSGMTCERTGEDLHNYCRPDS